MPLLLKWGEEIHFSCVSVVETVLLLLLLCWLFGTVGAPPESQLLEFLQRMGKDVCGVRGDGG